MENPFQAEICSTSDGSHTLKLVNYNEQYHSLNGALTESIHVFIKSGLLYLEQVPEKVNILEVGLGTGLNALLTAQKTTDRLSQVFYHALEPYPLEKNIIARLNYCKFIDGDWVAEIFEGIHSLGDVGYKRLMERFYIRVSKEKVSDVLLEEKFYHLIYFDAFSPEIQAELWTQDVFEKIFCSMVAGGILVTYCSKGSVRRAMVAAGFKVEKLPGPHLKREITRAIKL